MMNLALRVTNRNGFCPHGLASARGDQPNRHSAVGCMNSCAHHLAAKVTLRNDAIGAKVMKSVDCPSAPYGRRFAARKICKNVAIPVDSTCGNDYADLVGPKIVVPWSPRRIKCYDDRCTPLLGYVHWGATGRINNLVSPKGTV